MNAPTLTISLATIALIVLLGRTRLGSMGLVIAVIATSAAAYVGGWEQVATLGDLGVALDSLPSFELPQLRAVPALIIPAVSLRVRRTRAGSRRLRDVPNPDGTYPDGSRDFVGQGAANIASGMLRNARRRIGAERQR